MQQPCDPRRARRVAKICSAVALGAVISCHAHPSRGATDSGPALSASEAVSLKPEFVERRDGTALPVFVRKQVARGTAEHRRVLVYVGASWCEPCQRFHAAVESGELDEPLAGLRFLEFDRDKDGSDLDAAGYGSRLIPLIAIPGADGRGTNLRMEGSIKGPTAVHANMLPRLFELLARSAAVP